MTWPVRLLARKYEISFRYFFSYHILINKIEEMTRYLKWAGPVKGAFARMLLVKSRPCLQNPKSNEGRGCTVLHSR